MWGDARKITTNGTAIGQAKKTVEEAKELKDACKAISKASNEIDRLTAIREAKDAIGDVVVTLVMCAERLTRETGEDVDVVQCFRLAYEEIKDRKGYLNEQGIFIKETP